MACEPRKARRLLDWGGPHKTVIVMDMGAAGQAKVYDLDAAVFPRVPSLLRELKGHGTPGWFSPVQVIGRGGGTGDGLPSPCRAKSLHIPSLLLKVGSVPLMLGRKHPALLLNSC
jgi:hypothetical protein